jgi:hypothetical protein
MYPGLSIAWRPLHDIKRRENYAIERPGIWYQDHYQMLEHIYRNTEKTSCLDCDSNHRSLDCRSTSLLIELELEVP